jgi:hypothetical protein
LKKLREVGTSLGQYVGEQFYRGVVTGFNKAFVIDRTIRDKLIAEDPKSAEIIKPWLRGRDVGRWQSDWNGEYLVFTRRGIDIEEYPAVRDYLAQFKKRLTPGIKGGRKSGNYEWYEIQDTIAYYEEFEKPKILYPDIARRCEFTFDEQGYLSGNTTYFVPTDDLALLGILNSNVVEFFYRYITTTIQKDYLRFFTQYLEQIPIPEPTPAQREAIEALVGKLLAAEGQGPQVPAWERALNDLVYEVYGLTAEEIALVEPPNEFGV